MDGTVLYDGECRFCSSQVRFIRRHDRRNRFRFVPLQSEEGRSMLRSAGLPENDPDTVVYAGSERLEVRSSAVLKILGELGGAWRLVKVLLLIPPGLRDFFYRLIARNRHRLAPRRGRKPRGGYLI
jgi:predicted DCC family thiol-disulfide oxidoreductase YuxK